MLQIDISDDCGNTPKTELLKKLNIAFAEGDITTMLGLFANNIVWEMVGDRVIKGKDHIGQYLLENNDVKATRLVLHQVITHGKFASAHGLLEFKNMNIAFADFYEFSSAGSEQIINITSYAREIVKAEAIQ